MSAHEAHRSCILPSLHPYYARWTSRAQAAAGLSIPGTAMPYALDSFDGKPELIPIHHSNVSINNHTGANVAGEMAGSFFYKPKMTTELPGAAAAVTLHSRRPVLYFHLDDQDDSSADHNENLAGWTIVRAKSEKDKRIVSQIRLTQLTGTASATMTSSTPRKRIFRTGGRH